jgi:hypothetical protein
MAPCKEAEDLWPWIWPPRGKDNSNFSKSCIGRRSRSPDDSTRAPRYLLRLPRVRRGRTLIGCWNKVGGRLGAAYQTDFSELRRHTGHGHGALREQSALGSAMETRSWTTGFRTMRRTVPVGKRAFPMEIVPHLPSPTCPISFNCPTHASGRQPPRTWQRLAQVRGRTLSQGHIRVALSWRARLPQDTGRCQGPCGARQGCADHQRCEIPHGDRLQA